MKKFFLVMLMLVLAISQVSAIEGRIGNSRMVLHAETGELVERSILVINENSVPLTIEIGASGDLADNIELRDTTFVLLPGEEKKAYFIISSDNEGTFESKINVKFIPEEESGIGLSSTVVLIAAGEDKSNNENILDDLAYNDIDNNSNNTSDSPSTSTVLAISTAVLIIVLMALIVYANKRRNKKSVRRRSE